MHRSNAGSRGYVGIILALILFIVTAMGLTIAANYAIRMSQNRVATGSVQNDVFHAIIGDPANGSFGYVGDVGDYPASLADLLKDPTGSTAGWNGPYLRNVAIDSSGMLLDSYYSPLEYFLSVGVVASPSTHAVAIISRGPDHSSSNTAANPNVAAQFNTVLGNPVLPSYKTATYNVDNSAIPDFYTSGSALNFGYNGSLTYNLTNKDTASVSVPVPATCPLMYNLKIASATRGSSDQLILPFGSSITSTFGSSMTADLIQGIYNVSLVANSNNAQVFYSEAVPVFPGATTTRNFQTASIATVQVPLITFNVTIKNPVGGATVFIVNQTTGGTSLGSIAGNANSVFAVNACSTLTARTGSAAGPIIDQWVTPVAVYTRVVRTVTSTLTVTNVDAGKTHPQIGVTAGNPGIGIGSVYRKRVKVFTIPLGETVTVTDGTGAALAGTPLVLPAGNTNLSY